MDLPREPDNERKRALLQAAYERIAGEGFEGLRTRDVAADAGVNIATLHYYFPTKEVLIRAVVGFALSRFGGTIPTEGSGEDVLRGHLQAVAQLIKSDPRLWAVMGELALRAPRDPGLHDLLQQVGVYWHRKLVELLSAAADDGGVSKGLDVEDAASLIMASLRGLALPGMDVNSVDQVVGQLERWLGLE
jgi:AcrR family transcriptional regulator